MKRMITNKSRVTAARDAQIVRFSELTEEQKDKAINLANNDRRLSEIIYSWYDDMVMEDYHYNVSELADEFTAQTGIGVNVDKLYWQSSSQGPYPEWNLEQVFDNYASDSNDIEYNIEFSGKSTDIFDYTYVDLYLPDGEGDYYWEDSVACDEESLREYGADESTITEILGKTNAAQEFIDKVWELIKDVCTAYPDDEWIADTMEVNDFEFLVDGDNVSYVD